MRITAITAAILALAGTAYGAEKVYVYVNHDNVPWEMRGAITFAQGISSRMFATAGVAVEWRSGKPGSPIEAPPSRTIVIKFEMNTPPRDHPGGMAYAQPFEGIHIVVFYDRVWEYSRDFPGQRPMVLAHVMTHEITHNLQGVTRHSASGVMKARWDTEDFLTMIRTPLPFTPEDIGFLHDGLRQRETQTVLSSLPLTTRP